MTGRRLATIMSVDVVGYSRMMQRDAPGLLKALNVVFRTTVRPAVDSRQGRIVKLLGDGALAEFASAHAAIAAAVEVQRQVAAAPAAFSEPIRLRIGLDAGEVLSEGADIFGGCVNLAQRLQAAAEPGGILASGLVVDLAGGDLPCPFRAEGPRRFRNIDRAVPTYSADLTQPPAGARLPGEARDQEIRYLRTPDGVSLAWAATGHGPPLVKAPNWITHLELDWSSSYQDEWVRSLSVAHRLIRYDARSNGMSQRGVRELSLEILVGDLECVFAAAGVERAPLFALSQGCAIAVAFAVRAPRRVSGIVMMGGFAQGRARRDSPKSRAEATALNAMIDAGWDDPYPSLRDLLAERIMPLASLEERRRFAENMRQMITGEDMLRYREVIENIDVTGLLPQVQAPCLVLHCRGDRQQPIDQGRALAAGIPNARFVALDSSSHVVTDSDPCWPQAERDIHAFLDGLAGPP